ncbi:hypothetical protein KC349_g19 [Hortaea werneckii]|nr:hypothetical protein KC349_g19 [Hortaea werneckii]
MPAAREVCHRKLCLDVSGKGKLGGYMKKDKYCMNVGPLVVRSNGSADFNVAKPNRDLQGRHECLRHRTRVTPTYLLRPMAGFTTALPFFTVLAGLLAVEVFFGSPTSFSFSASRFARSRRRRLGLRANTGSTRGRRRSQADHRSYSHTLPGPFVGQPDARCRALGLSEGGVALFQPLLRAVEDGRNAQHTDNRKHFLRTVVRAGTHQD